MKSTIELAKEADFHVSGDRVFSPYAGGTSLNALLETLVAIVRAEYEAPLKLAEEALEMFGKHYSDGNEALATIRAARAQEQVEQEPVCECHRKTSAVISSERDL